MDLFGAAALRERVLEAWAASPARFREDANAEDELVRGAYRDRLVVELAQNAADAGARSGAAARLLLRLDGDTLVAANTGAPLDAAGVEGLSTLRASPKRDDEAVGRFGVGFAAVLAVTDEPMAVTAVGGVRWGVALARDAARRAAAHSPGLADDLRHRADTPPLLRLPFAVGSATAQGLLPPGYDTAIVLPLRDSAVTQVRRLLAEVDDALLLALPNLAEVVVEVDGVGALALRAQPPAELAAEPATGSVLSERRVGERVWRLCERSGVAEAELLADRTLEERARPRWSAAVAVPVDAGLPAPLPETTPRVLHAPTPTDDPTDLPVLVVVSFPLDSSRRRVQPGPLAEHLIDEVGRAYAALAASFVPPGPAASDPAIGSAVLRLVPAPIGVGDVDTALRRAIGESLAATPFVPAADGGRLRPADVNLVDGLDARADLTTLASVVAGLPAAGWWRPEALRRLGARVVPLADVVDELAGLQLEPAGWRGLYDALDGSDPEALGALPVPLADGRTVRGPRGLLLPGEVDAALMAPFPLRVVAPDAAHPLLRRLGAVEASAASVLRDPAVRGAVVELADGDADPGPVTSAVLGLVAQSGLTSRDEPWLAELPLPVESGDIAVADELLLPGARLLEVLEGSPAEHTVAAAVVEEFGAQTLRAVGVRDGFGVVRDDDLWLDDDVWHDLDDEDGWVDSALAELAEGEPPRVAEFVAVRDLDVVRDDAWAVALALLAADPEARAAVVEPTALTLADGTRRTALSYTAWWIRRHARIDGLPLARLCLAGADRLTRMLLRVVDLPLDDAFASAVGLAADLADVDANMLLDRLAAADVKLSAADLALVYAELARRDPAAVDPPDAVRVPDGEGSRLAGAADVVVCDGPHWLQLAVANAVPGPAMLADILDVDLASEALDGQVSSGPGQRRPVPEVVGRVLPEAPEQYVEHDDLRVGGRSVQWWVTDDGTVHAGTLDGLARGLAWAAGQWQRRWLVAEALRDPGSLQALLAEDAFG